MAQRSVFYAKDGTWTPGHVRIAIRQALNNWEGEPAEAAKARTMESVRIRFPELPMNSQELRALVDRISREFDVF